MISNEDFESSSLLCFVCPVCTLFISHYCNLAMSSKLSSQDVPQTDCQNFRKYQLIAIGLGVLLKI